MPLLSIAIWLPIVAGVLLLAFGRDDRADAVRWAALIAATASSTTPATIGSQMARLSKPMLSFSFYARVSKAPRNGQSCQVMRPITPTIMTSAYQ